MVFMWISQPPAKAVDELCQVNGCSKPLEAGEPCVINSSGTGFGCKSCGLKYGVPKYWGNGDIPAVFSEIPEALIIAYAEHGYALNSPAPADAPTVHLMSFSWKYGLPQDAGLGSKAWKIVDCRKTVRNPWRNDKLRKLCGRHPDVQEFLQHCKGAQAAMSGATMAVNMFKRTHVAFGCFGGKHRSVALTEMLAKQLRTAGRQVEVIHRDLPEKWRDAVFAPAKVK